MRSSFAYHKMHVDERTDGHTYFRRILSLLEGYESAPAAAWETDLIPARM